MVLVTGGAGYIGTTLIPQLLETGYKVRVLDSLIFGGNPLLPFIRNANFEFQKGDIRSYNDVKKAVKNADIIIHLAAIVGYPACRKDPKLAQDVNIGGVKNLIKITEKSQLVIFASTGSGYGYVREIATEKTPLKPLSLYGQTKSLGEQLLLKRGNVIVYRFATAFGISPRLRLDLLINDFTYRALSQGYLVVYEKHYKRTFIHVSDMGKALCFAIENSEKMKNQIYNIGSDNLSFSKKEVCDLIKQRIKVHVNYSSIGEDSDKRNYAVSFKKINSLGFYTSITIDEGIKELIKTYPLLSKEPFYSNV